MKPRYRVTSAPLNENSMSGLQQHAINYLWWVDKSSGAEIIIAANIYSIGMAVKKLGT